MAKYLLLECNRLRGNNTFKNLSEEEDIFKNKWTNNISPSGIVVNVGDTLSIEEIIVNSRGASDSVMEINGTANENGFLDNIFKLDVSFYINHISRNTARMPFTNHKTYRGVGSVIDPVINTTTEGTGLIVPLTNGQIRTSLPYNAVQSGTGQNLKQMLSRRSLGEVLFKPNNTSGQKEWDVDKLYKLEDYCNGSMTMNMKTTVTGAGQANNPNSGYKVGVYDALASIDGVGMKIRIESVIVEGSIGGIVESWSVEEQGIGFVAGETISLPKEQDGTTPIAGTVHVFETLQFPSLDSYQSSDIRQADGERYYYSNHDYTGLVDRRDYFLTDPIVDADTLVSNMTKRKEKITLQSQQGFLTPDNLANILTDQMHEPTRINRLNNIGSYVDLSTLIFQHTLPNKGLVTQGNPVLVETPTYKPIPSNFDYSSIKDNGGRATLSGARRGFYNGLAYKDADRFFGLKNAFYNFSYKDTTTEATNDIVAGTVGSFVDDLGDFNEQETGDLGVRVCLMNKFASNGDFHKVPVNSPVVTNMKWNKKNLLRIQKAFRKSEQYLGDQSKTTNVGDGNYIAYLAVNLDLGMYDDELSTQGDLTIQKTTSQPYANQRTKFNNFFDATSATDPQCEVPVDLDNDKNCQGFQKDFNNLFNDGQQLSSIWVRSRHDGNIQYGKGDLDFDEFMTNNNTAPFTTNYSADEIFLGTWVDEDGEEMNVEKATQYTAGLDINIIPVFGRANQNGNIYSETPFIAFSSFMNCDAITKPFNKNFPAQNNWQIDFRNANFGTQIGLDPSFTRNQAVCSLSPMLGNANGSQKIDYMNLQFIGAVDPTILFDPALSRFGISNLNTQTTLSNGLLTDIPETITASGSPEQPVIKINRLSQVCPQRQKWLGAVPADESGTIQLADVKIIGQFNKAHQKEGTILESQSGISIEGVILVDEDLNETELLNIPYLGESNDVNLFNYSLLDKMGFQLKQFIPEYGGEQATFSNDFISSFITKSYEQAKLTIIKPVTTGSYISSAEIQTLSTNTLNMPMYDLGVDAGRPVQPTSIAGTITAFNLPTKLTYPYLCVYSSIPSGGTDTQWIGGGDGHSKISCMGYLTRNENEGDFFYTTGTTFNFTATKQFIISEIETDFRLPDGSRPKLEPQSCVIYKITKPIQSVSPDNLIRQPTRTDKKK